MRTELAGMRRTPALGAEAQRNSVVRIPTFIPDNGCSGWPSISLCQHRWANADRHVEYLKLDAVDQVLAVPIKNPIRDKVFPQPSGAGVAASRSLAGTARRADRWSA